MTAPSQVVWKFPLDLTGPSRSQTVQMPAGARLVHCAWFQGRPTMWWLVEQTESTTTRYFQIVATGEVTHPHDQAIHVGTVIQADTFVWHIFELPAAEAHGSAAPHGR